MDNGSWPISNNPCENSIRLFIVGRRGWLFCDTVAGAHASANLNSLMETAKASDIDPYSYLRFMLKALLYAQSADDYEKLLPWNMAASETPV